MPDETTKTDAIEAIYQEVLHLSQSPLYDFRVKHSYKPVIGQGDLDADIMFIGEAPGKNEAEQGVPFCGASGRVLDELLEGIGLARDSVYITNIVKDRPPNNRDPHKGEVELYAPYLERQIDLIQPRIIATLGRFAMSYILKKFDHPRQKEPISKLHGAVLDAEADYGPIKLLPLYHPAVSLYNASQRTVLEEDFATLKSLL